MSTINDYVMKNLIYCEDTHSFVHRLFEKWKEKMPEDQKQAKESAWDVVLDMNNIEMEHK